MARRQQNQWLVKNPICRKFAHETNPCAKIVNKFAREFAHMRFPSLQRLNLLQICVQVSSRQTSKQLCSYNARGQTGGKVCQTKKTLL